jgi:peptidoglycan hydrolase-like protein with peptidoglycan-binding domain
LPIGNNTGIFYNSAEVISLKSFKEETPKMSSALWKGLLAFSVLFPSLTFASAALALLQRGDRGGAVYDLQERLRVPADGVFGAQTEAAVLDFQRSNGLFEDGVAGPQTLEALGLDPDSRADVPLRPTGSFGAGAVSEGPYQVVIPGNDFEELSRARQVVDANFADDSDRGKYIDAGRYASRDLARDVVDRLQNVNLDARVEFRN